LGSFWEVLGGKRHVGREKKEGGKFKKRKRKKETKDFPKQISTA
jgi:hypothetical protein